MAANYDDLLASVRAVGGKAVGGIVGAAPV